jgi:signal transduction histidine kinase
VVESAIAAVRPAADAKHISMRLTVSDEPTPVMADSGRLRQVITNVLMNAVKFSPEGSAVEAAVSTREALIEILVIDRGVGISAETLPHVFERFWQGPESNHERYQGLGLGLHIARTLIELHGGTIALDSDGEGQGTACRITLPRWDPSAQLSQVAAAVTGAS